MTSLLKPNIWLWKEPECQYYDEVLKFIKNQELADKDVIVLHCGNLSAKEDSTPLLLYLFGLCHQFKIFKCEKVMFLDPKDFLRAIELCLEKGKSEDPQITKQTLIECHEAYIQDLIRTDYEVDDKTVSLVKKFLLQNNCIDAWKLISDLQNLKGCNQQFETYVANLKFLILGTTEKQLMEYVDDVFTSFLSLLVNSRNELSLSRVMVSPFINLSHEAFTYLKHLAAEKEMPMCQTAISYVMRLRLGGKGYAPPTNCPLLPHLKSLETFVDTLNQLQTIIEEEPAPRLAIKKMINVLKKKLLKCVNDKFKSSAIEAACADLLSTAEKVLKINIAKEFICVSPQICQETLDFLYYFVNYISCSSQIFDPRKILLLEKCERTPINLPPLLGYFRSPEEVSTCDEKSVHDEDSVLSNNSSLGFPPPLMSYFHHSDNSCSVSSTCIETQTPTKTSFKDCIEKNIVSQTITKSNLQAKNVRNQKRSILGDVTNETDRPRKSNKTVPLKGDQAEKTNGISLKKRGKQVIKKTKLSKKFKQLEGQGRITKFFTTLHK